MVKKSLLFAGLLALLITPFVFAEVDPEGTDPVAENVKAVEAVTAGNYYQIFTYSDGSAITGTKYYLQADGYLTSDATKAGKFPLTEVSRTINTATGDIDVTAFKFGARFTNPTLTNGSNGDIVPNGHINVNSKDNRDDFESQVFFLGKSGNYAIRATAAKSENWGANTYWTATDTNADGLPEADYTLTPSYIWQLADVTDAGFRDELQALIDEVANIVDNRIGVGNGPFMKSEDNLATLNTYLQSAKSIADNPNATVSQLQAAQKGLSDAYAEFKAAGNAPKADAKYLFIQKASGQYMAFSETEDRVIITDTPTELSIISDENGAWYITDGTKYVGLAGNNAWTMSAAPENKVSVSPEVVNVNGSAYYTLNEKNGLIATDATTSGSYCYADKSVAKSGDKAYWTIVENSSVVLLNKAIEDAEAAIGQTGGVFQHTEEAAATLRNAINEAKSYANNPNLTNEMAEYQTNALNTHVEAYLNSPVALPVSGQPYTIQLNGTDLYMNISEGAQVQAKASNLFFEVAGENVYFLKDADGHYISLTPGENPNDNWTMSNVADQKVALDFEYSDGAYHIHTPSGYIGMDEITEGASFWADKPKGKSTWLIADGKEEVIEGTQYAGIIEQTQSHPLAGVIGTTTTAQTVTINLTDDTHADITFSGFEMPMAALGSFDQFTIEGVAVTKGADGSISFAPTDFQIASGISPYRGTIEGTQASADATPVLHMTLQNATLDDCYFGADQAAIDAYKAAQPHPYEFVAAEWPAGDAARISPSNVVVDETANTITVDAKGTNNVALNFKTDKTYIVPAACKYFVIKATGLSTADGQSYLWWLNAKNVGSQVPPTAIYEEEGVTVFAWDMQASGIGGTLGLEDTELNKDGADTWGWTTTFGMTLADQSVPAVISYIGFIEALPEPEPEALELAINVDYFKGQNGLNYTVDYAEALAFLGIESIEQATIVGVNMTTGEEVADYISFDGWRNKDGDYQKWGTDAAVCVKFANEPEKYAIYDMGNDNVPAVGDTFKARFAIKANDKTVFYTVNVKFIEKPQAEYTFDQLNKLLAIDIEVESECGKFFEGLTASLSVNTILRNLGVDSMDEVAIYAVQSDNSMDSNYKRGNTDGWRDANGDWQAYPGAFYVKADFDLTENQFYEIGGMQGGTEEPATYTATFAFVKKGTKDAMVVRVNLKYTLNDGINGIIAEKSAPVIYDLSGRRVEKAQNGIFIINGKKVAIK